MIDGREFHVHKTPMSVVRAMMHGPPSTGGEDPISRIKHALEEMTLVLRDKNGDPPTMAMLERDFDVEEIAEVRREYQRLDYDTDAMVAELDQLLSRTLKDVGKDQPLWMKLRLAMLRRTLKKWSRKAAKM